MSKPRVNIETYTMETVLGKSQQRLCFLTNEQMDDLNDIGYSGKLRGKKMTRQQYLDKLKDAVYIIEQMRFDHGDFIESFNITRITHKPKIKKVIK